MLSDLLINISASIIYDFGKAIKSKAAKNETVQTVLKQLGASPDLHDFPSRYVEALVEFRFLEKDSSVMAFFREESIAQVFFDFYYGDNSTRNNEAIFRQGIAYCVESLKVGDDIIEKKVDVTTEVNQFWQVFRQKVQDSRTVKEVEVEQTLEHLKRKTDDMHQLLMIFLNWMKEQGKSLIQIADKIYNIENIDTALFGSLLSKFRRHLTSPPFLSEVFVGRKEDIQHIYERLFSAEGNLLLLNGEGGIGKTTLAARYYHDYCYEYQHVAWVLSEQNIAAAVLSLAAPLRVKFEDAMPTVERFQALLIVLANLPKPCLLVVDNANEMEDLEVYYPQLQRCTNFHVLFTTRINEYAAAAFYKIPPLPMDMALMAFRKHYKAFEPAEESVFRELYEAVGGNTLVLELFAKKLNHFNSKLKKRYLLADLRQDVEKNLLRLSASEAVTIGYQAKDGQRKAKPEEVIAAMYDLSALPDEEQALLSVLSVLPAEPMAYYLLERLLVKEKDEEQEKLLTYLKLLKDNKGSLDGVLAITGLSKQQLNAEFKKLQNARLFSDVDQSLLSLAQKGWLDYSDTDKSFKITPVVQAVTRTKNAERLLNDCRGMFNSLLRGLDNNNRHQGNYQQAAIFARLGEAVIFSVLTPDRDVATLCQNIGNFHKETGNLSLMMKAYQNMLEIQTALCSTEPDNADFKNGLAVSYLKLGEAYITLGDLNSALSFFEKSNDLEKKLYTLFPGNMDIKKGLAISYEWLGQTYSNLGNRTQARILFEYEATLFEEMCVTFPKNMDYKHGLAIAFQFLAITNNFLGERDIAIKYFEECSRIAKELYVNFPQRVEFIKIAASSYQYLGIVQKSLNKKKEALLNFQNFNHLMNELHSTIPHNVEIKKGLAISFQHIGDIYMESNLASDALKYYKLYNEQMKELHKVYPDIVEFTNHLGISYSKLGKIYTSIDREKSLEYLNKRFGIAERLNIDFKENINFQNAIAEAAFNLGKLYQENFNDIINAVKYYKISIKYWNKLALTYPQKTKYQEYLSSIRHLLNILESS